MKALLVKAAEGRPQSQYSSYVVGVVLYVGLVDGQGHCVSWGPSIKVKPLIFICEPYKEFVLRFYPTMD